MRYELRRIEIWPVAKIVFILSLFLGFFIGVLYGGIFAIIENYASPEEAMFVGQNISGAALVIVFVLMCTILIPIFYTAFSIMFVALYNLVASWVGGFRFELQSIGAQVSDHSSVG